MSSSSSSSSSRRSVFVMAFNFMSSQRAVAALVILVGCLLCLRGASAAPSYDFLTPTDKIPTVFDDDNACYHDAKVEELCQHCAKATKSPVVYPMCCGDLEEARAWCKAYLDYGKTIVPS